MTSIRIAILVVLFGLSAAIPAIAQDIAPTVAVGWAPIFLDNVSYHVLSAWALEVSGSTSLVARMFDIKFRCVSIAPFGTPVVPEV